MHTYKSQFLNTLDTRGYIRQVTHVAELDAYCQTPNPAAYIGFDATADSLHVGSLVGIMMLRHLQQAGGKPIILIGGGTTRVGDPTGKETARPLLGKNEIAHNIKGIKQAFSPFLHFGDGPNDAVFVNNNDWIGDFGHIEFLHAVGRHFTVNTMLKQETVAARLRQNQPYSFLEFSYSLLQSHDFLELSRRYDCRLQMGGSDQWGNIVGGIDLVHKVDGKQGFGLTCPLITLASGCKMGKTADGAVWLSAERFDPYHYWQFWRNTADRDVGRFLRLFTELPLDEIARLEALDGAESNIAKIALADGATSLLHGKAAARVASATASRVFRGHGVSGDLPTFEIRHDSRVAGPMTSALLRAAQLVSSNSEARRKIGEGAVRVNDTKVTTDHVHDWGGILAETGSFKVQLGKKRIALVKPV